MISKKALSVFLCISISINGLYLLKDCFSNFEIKESPQNMRPTWTSHEFRKTNTTEMKHETIETKTNTSTKTNTFLDSEYNEMKGSQRKEHEHSTVQSHDIELVLNKRRQSMQQACEITTPHPTIEGLPWSEYILVSNKLKMVYCMIPKVASSSWLTALLTLHMGIAIEELDVWPIWKENVHPPHLTDYSTEIQKKILGEYFKFMFIRDPLDRLISAWDDKFNHTKPYYSHRYGTEIIQRYRANPSIEAVQTGDNVTFNELVSYITDIDVIQRADEHWRPMTDLCHPCLIDYDMYGNFYNVEEESKFVFKNLDINESNMTLPHANLGNNNTKSILNGYNKTVETSKLKEFYSHISLEKIIKLQDQYKQDYALFSDALQLNKLVED
ncbi:unnamed protein product [Owenia fusiformis]|uniref:Carbohydrate sulfotransferase n=1 Tax=Owenia fusiformis TaxID=6347 RepID=A0A8J1T605_OWEFU|nr:unnamed protein product [Owenia fusiformis]